MANGAPTIETTEKKPEGQTPASPPAGGAPAAKDPVVPKETKETKEPVTPKPKADAGGEPTERKRASLKGDDDDIPDDADLLELTPRALKSRLNRHTKKELKERFGTDDVEEIQAKMKRLESLEKAEEERKTAELSEKEKLEKERDKEKARADAAELKTKEIHEQRIFDKQETRMTRLAEKHLDPDYVDVTLPRLAKWLKRNFKKDELKSLKDKDIEPFFKDLVEKRPKLAKDYDPEKAKPKPKVPVTNGADTGERPAGNPSGTAEKKTYAPNRPNSMSRAEAKKEAGKEGYNW